ncbi:hypothetical protein EBZ39_16275 [bacterium]|nr:hypothetical protein [bacterium]
MGFDDFSFQRFIKQQNLRWGSVAMRDRPLKLMERKAVGAYYRFLEQEAESVGTQLKDGLHTILPGAAIMCYMPHIQISWFYKGLVKGLTDAKKPMQLLTFNSEFVAHQEWFDQQRSPVTHACVLMLSKIREVADFDWVSHLLLRHGAIWLNRFSRTVEPLAKDWRAIEQLALPTDQAGQFYSFVRSQ